MCGRYAASADPDELVEIFEVDVDATAEPTRGVLANPQVPPPGAPDYNVAPSKQAPVVVERRLASAGDGEVDPAGEQETVDGSRTEGVRPAVRQLRLLSWGLVPSWSKDLRSGARMTNARAETVLDKPAYRRAITSRRALVPAAGWYEWQASPTAVDVRGRPRRQPFFVSRDDGDLVALAGLYEFWKDPALPAQDPLSWLVTFAIVTTAAEPGLDRIHDRQPVVLERDRWDRWLDPALTDPAAVSGLLRSPGAGRFRTWPVGTAVNATRNNGPELLTPVALDQLPGVVDPMTGEVLDG